jgi:hypothetical protein
MASIPHALSQIKHRLQQLVPRQPIDAICGSVGHVWHRCTLDPATTIHLMLLQLLTGAALSGLRHVAKVSVSVQAVAQARMRLPLAVWAELVANGSPRQQAPALWKKLRVWVADGMSFLTADTPALGKRFGRAQNQHGECKGYPTPKLLCLWDWTSGMIAKAIPLPWGRQEQTCLSRLFALLKPADLLLGDRGLVGFAHLALLWRQGAAGLFRLPKNKIVKGRGKNKRTLLRRLGRQDLLVRWEKSQRPSWLSDRRWRQLPAALTLRQVALRIRRRGYRDRWAWLVTTLLNPRQYPAQELVELYGRRWRVEVCFRDLRQSLGLRKISAKKPQGVRKELLAFVLLYNLVRAVTAEAAARQRVDGERVSFIDAVRWLLWAEPGEQLPELVVNTRRQRPAQPRRVKGGGKIYPLLNATRAALQQPAGVAIV